PPPSAVTRCGSSRPLSSPPAPAPLLSKAAGPPAAFVCPAGQYGLGEAMDVDDDRERRILEAIRAIPEGFVRTYGDVSPGAPRLAGHVLKTVHDADLPWWRVVRADGSLAAGDEQ